MIAIVSVCYCYFRGFFFDNFEVTVWLRADLPLSAEYFRNSYYRDSSVNILFEQDNDLNTYQIFTDLVISVSLVLLLIYKQRVRKKQGLMPFLICYIGTFFLGSSALFFHLVWDKIFS